MTPRRRILMKVSAAIVVVWLIALGGFALSRATRVTPERIARELRSSRFSTLSAQERLRMVRKIAGMLNRLSPDERRAARLDPGFGRWFRDLATAEKEVLLELTVPTGFNQMLAAFEQMPENRRRRAIADSVRRLNEGRERMESNAADPDSTDAGRPQELSPELQEKVVTLGLRSFYETGSPDLKAELAPVLGELQRAMESGRGFRLRRRSGE